MINVRLTYNPYLVRTTLEINGNLPETDSMFNIPNGVRLQEWIDEFPREIAQKYNDK